MTNTVSDSPITFYRTETMPCPYLTGQTERNIFTELKQINSKNHHETLTRAGFRRSQKIIYRPSCPTCSSCVPIRIVAKQFSANRSERRIIKRNNELNVKFIEPIATKEHYHIFNSYQKIRHKEGEMASMKYQDFKDMVEISDVDTKLLEFRTELGILVAGCIVDRISDAYSAVYSYYDPKEQNRSLGNFMILWLTNEASKIGLSYVYLGYWIKNCNKMAYKTRYKPIEILGSTGWVNFDGNVFN